MFSQTRKPVAATTAPAKHIPKAVKTAAPSIIGPDLRITGNLVSDGTVQIDGTINGDVSAGSVTIAEQAQVSGTVGGDQVMVRGSVTGQVQAKTVTLARTARVHGDVVHASVEVEPGARIEGQFRRMDDAPAAPAGR